MRGQSRPVLTRTASNLPRASAQRSETACYPDGKLRLEAGHHASHHPGPLTQKNGAVRSADRPLSGEKDWTTSVAVAVHIQCRPYRRIACSRAAKNSLRTWPRDATFNRPDMPELPELAPCALASANQNKDMSDLLCSKTSIRESPEFILVLRQTRKADALWLRPAPESKLRLHHRYPDLP